MPTSYFHGNKPDAIKRLDSSVVSTLRLCFVHVKCILTVETSSVKVTCQATLWFNPLNPNVKIQILLSLPIHFL